MKNAAPKILFLTIAEPALPGLPVLLAVAPPASRTADRSSGDQRHFRKITKCLQGFSINPWEIPASSNLTLSLDFLYHCGVTEIDRNSTRTFGLMKDDAGSSRFLTPRDISPPRICDLN